MTEERKPTKREGVVRTYQHHNNRLAVLVEIASQTDFVARNKEFLAFADEMLLHIAAYGPASVPELMEQAWLLDESVTVGNIVEQQQKKFGEKIVVISFVRWTLDPSTYLSDDSTPVE